MMDSTGVPEGEKPSETQLTPQQILKNFTPEFNQLAQKHGIKAAFISMNLIPMAPGETKQKFQIAVNGDEDVVGYVMSLQTQINMLVEELNKLRSAPIQKPPLQFRPH